MFSEDLTAIAEKLIAHCNNNTESEALEALEALYAPDATSIEALDFSGIGLIFSMDVTEKESGDRTQSRELGLYTVKDGKIVSEAFYYSV